MTAAQETRGIAPIKRLSALSTRRNEAILLGATWLGATVFVAARLNQGWVPHDDGSFAQSATRVLAGQLPHREFAELYTGGMTFLNAGVFWLFGQDLIWLRIPMFAIFVAFVPVYYALARRFVPPWMACLITLAGVAWSYPLYPAAVPSWYILFFSTFGVYCVVRYFESGKLAWLFSGGVLGGVAISFKIVGIWYVIAALLTLVTVNAARRSDRNHRTFSSLLIPAAAGLLALVFVRGVFGSSIGAVELANLLIPVAVLCCLPVALAAIAGPATFDHQLRADYKLGGLFALGVALPLLILAVPYALSGSLQDLLSGVFDSPRSRLAYAYAPMPQPRMLLYAVPLVVAFALRPLLSQRLRLAFDGTLVALLVWLLATAHTGEPSREILWNTARSTAPLLIVLGAVALAFSRDRRVGNTNTAAAILLLLVAGFASLSQFPFYNYVYFAYVAPLVLLAAVAIVQQATLGRGLLPTATVVGVVLFGFVILDGTRVRDLSGSPEPLAILDHDRASIKVPVTDRTTYRQIVTLLNLHARGNVVFAGPDAPQVYYLTGRENPTRALFDFLDGSNSARGTQLLRTLRNEHINAIAINNRPQFSDPLPTSMITRLDSLFPHNKVIGGFDVRWRDDLPAG